MTAPLDGPRLAPASGGPAQYLVVLVHGYGADGKDLIALGHHWQDMMPDAAFAAPNGPERCNGSPMGYQWFPITRLDPDEIGRGVEAAAPLLDAFLDAELERHGLDGSRLALVGFSQGTMMALHAGLRRNPGPRCILGYSGALALPERLGEAVSKPPVMLIHGDQDDMLPVAAMHAAAGALADAEVSVRWHVSRGVGHGIDPEGLALGGRFIADGLAPARA